MRTALIRTDIWKDKAIRLLNIDTKLVYLCIITNPDRNTTRFIKLDEDYLCLQSGVDHRQLILIKKQLEESGLVYFYEDWAAITDQSYVAPARGKLSVSIYNSDLEKVPDEVKSLINKDKKYLSGSGDSPEYIYNNNNIYNNKDKDKKSAVEFSRFWDLYPAKKRVRKPWCQDRWKKINYDVQLLILEDITKRKETRDWKKEDGKYVPNASTYLNGEYWEAEVPTTVLSKIKPTKLITGDAELDSF